MSGKQKSRQIKEKRAALREKAQKAEASELEERIKSEGVRVNVDALGPYNNFGPPKFVELGCYLDQPFTCKGCGKEEIWTGHQQKWWYEIAKGNVWSVAKHCRSCRRKEQARKRETRRVHQEGLAHKREHP